MISNIRSTKPRARNKKAPFKKYTGPVPHGCAEFRLSDDSAQPRKPLGKMKLRDWVAHRKRVRAAVAHNDALVAKQQAYHSAGPGSQLDFLAPLGRTGDVK